MELTVSGWFLVIAFFILFVMFPAWLAARLGNKFLGRILGLNLLAAILITPELTNIESWIIPSIGWIVPLLIWIVALGLAIVVPRADGTHWSDRPGTDDVG